MRAIEPDQMAYHISSDLPARGRSNVANSAKDGIRPREIGPSARGYCTAARSPRKSIRPQRAAYSKPKMRSTSSSFGGSAKLNHFNSVSLRCGSRSSDESSVAKRPAVPRRVSTTFGSESNRNRDQSPGNRPGAVGFGAVFRPILNCWRQW